MKKLKSTFFQKTLTALAVTTLIGMSATAHADNRSSNILGTVQLDNVTASGYTVIIKNIDNGRTRTITTDSSGEFKFSKIDIGSYDLTILKDGVVVGREKVHASLGGNAVANFDLETSTNVETIEVIGSRVSGIDLSSADSGLTLGEAQIDLMPVSRNITAIALLAPGTVQGDSQFGNTASFGGSSVAENSCYINGLEVTNTSQGLGCGSVPFEFYKEFQVKTGGYSAQFGRTTGGIVNSVTKSGTNEWEFAATALYRPEGLRDEGGVSRSDGGTGDVFRNKSKNVNGLFEYTVSAAGPIIEDKLFVYALLNPRDVSSEFSSQSSGRSQYAVDNRFIKRDSSSSDNLFWGAKVDWLITDDHTLSLFAYSNKNDTESKSYQFNAKTEEVGDLLTTTVLKRGGDVTSLSYTGNITDDLTISALYGEIETEYTNTPDNLTCPSISDTRQLPAGQLLESCGGGSVGVNVDKNKQFRLDVEYVLDEHTILVGYDQQTRETNHTSAPITGHSWTYSTLAPNASIQGTNGNLYTNNTGANLDYVSDRIFSGGGGFSTELTAWYIEDSWAVTDNLTLTLGARQDEFENEGVTGLVFSSFKTDIAPRLGFTLDPTGEGESKVYGTFGRYYLPVPNNTNYRAASGVSDSTTYYTFSGSDSITSAPTGLSPIAGNNSTVVNSVPNPATQATFQSEEAEPFSKDELILGYQHQMTDDLVGSVRFIRREVATALDDYCGPLASQATCTLINPGKDGTWQLDNNFDNVIDKDSRKTYTAAEIGLPEAKNEYTAIQTQLDYTADNLNLSFIYTWSRSVGNFEGAVKSDIGQADPGITQDFDFPALMDGADGYQANDRRHVFKLFGSYRLTDDLTVGFNSILSSGRPLSAFGQGYPDHSSNIYGSYGDTFYLYQNSCPDTNGNAKCDQAEKEYNRVTRGSVGRTPWTFKVDLSANYKFEVDGIDMRATLNVYNVLNTQSVTSQNEHYEARRSEGTYNKHYGAAYTWQTPRYVELGFEARF